jgi:cytochrome c-type biogenesis protein CcmF
VIPELGQLAVLLALCVAVAQSVLGLAGAARGDPAWMAATRSAAGGQLVLVAAAFACLVYAFVTGDFSVRYVANNSNAILPLVYRVTAVWGGHEGSFLLWTLMLSGWSAAVAAFGRGLPDDMVARVLGVMGLVGVGFLAFIAFTSNPFVRLLPAAADGRDLNPLLQDPGMVLHPPLLYMGYVGFSVVFAFAIAALLSGRLDAAWARWSRPWTTVAWTFLTLGIALGSYWAYYELGWGGWWFWDPVENASFAPWLVGTALMHSLAVTEKRGTFRSWTVLLAIVAFSLSLLGAFLVRSGVLTSVHAFATDPTRGLYMLAFLTLVVGGSLALYAARAPQLGPGGAFGTLSREAMLLVNNVLLVVAAASVMLGTLYPLLLDALGLGQISVGPPYFEAVFVPLMMPALFLMGVGPLVRWKSANLPELALRLRWAAGVGAAVAILLPFVLGRWSWQVSLGLLAAAWIVATTVSGFLERLRAGAGRTLAARLAGNSRSYYGMLSAHLGVAVFVVGVTLVGGYGTEQDAPVAPGQTISLAGFDFRFDGVRDVEGPNYTAVRATVTVGRDGRPVATLHPEKRLYSVQESPMTEAAIDSGITRDLYVALGDPVSASDWVLRVQHKPFIVWIWGGCLLMALGGLLAASDSRYRVKAAAALDPPAAARGRPRGAKTGRPVVARVPAGHRDPA